MTLEMRTDQVSSWMNFMLKAAIFDMDGVIVDSITCDYSSWKHFFSLLEIELSIDEYKRFSGMRAIQILKPYLGNIDEEGASTLESIRDGNFLACLESGRVKLVKGLKVFLDDLVESNLRISLATASTRNRAMEILRYFELEDYFEVIVTGDDVRLGKPNPETFLIAAKKLDCLPNETIVFEDTPNGVKAAKSGSMICVGLTTTHRRNEMAQADLIIDSFEDLNVMNLQDFVEFRTEKRAK